MKFNIKGGDASQYNLGRGIVLIKGQYPGGGWQDLGNCTSFTISQESETKEHRSSLQGLQVIDIDVPVSQKMTVSFTLDEISSQNLGQFFSGTTYHSEVGAFVANAAAIDSGNVLISSGNQNFYLDTAPTDYVIGVWFDLQLTLPVHGLVRAYDFEPNAAQAITVRKQVSGNTDTSGGTLLTEGTHYEVDRKMGRIRFLTGGIAAGDTFLVQWAAPTDAAKVAGVDTQLAKTAILTNSGLSVGVKFVGVNPNDGDKPYEIEFFQVKLKPDGEFSAIGDDWTELSFQGVAEAVSNPPPMSSPYGRVTSRSVYNT